MTQEHSLRRLAASPACPAPRTCNVAHPAPNAHAPDAYAAAHSAYIRLIKLKARKWSQRGAGDLDDLVQEGRITLAKALSTHDADKGSLTTWLGLLLDRRFSNIKAKALAQVRTPHIWEHDAQTGEWLRVPYQPTSMTCEDGTTLEPDALAHEDTAEALAEARAERQAAIRLRARIQCRLSGREHDVFDCLVRPTPALLIVARNLSGEDDATVTIPHIAAYLGLTKNQVDYSIHKIKKTANDVFSALSASEVALIRRLK